MTTLLDAPAEARFRVTAWGCEFTVFGLPQPGGSKKAHLNPKTKKIVIRDDNKKAKPWKEQIEKVAAALFAGREPYDAPLTVIVEFYVPRPKGHFGVHGVKRTAPKYPVVRPDATKLMRPLEDALTGIVWKDDARIVEQVVRKVYGEPPRAEVKVVVKV